MLANNTPKAKATTKLSVSALAKKRKMEGIAFLLGFIACVPAANYLIQYVGVFCVGEGGPCVIPVTPAISPQIYAPSGVLVIGIAFVLRDLVQRRLGIWWAVLAIGAGAVLSIGFAPAGLIIASTTAFFISELIDLAVYTPLQKRGLILAAVASSIVGLVVDSLVFLQLAFGDLEFITGQIIGKTWMILVAIPFLYWLRARDKRIGLGVA